MLKRSAGILVYRMNHSQIEVLLCHMGGPYWQNQDIGAWSIPKGMIEPGENVLEGACREFQEETGFVIEKEKLFFLGSKKQASYKLVIVFTGTKDFDCSKATSNTFLKEWPKGSGNICEFPEMDQAAWIPLEEAKTKILTGQVYFLEKLKRKLAKEK